MFSPRLLLSVRGKLKSLCGTLDPYKDNVLVNNLVCEREIGAVPFKKEKKKLYSLARDLQKTLLTQQVICGYLKPFLLS